MVNNDPYPFPIYNLFAEDYTHGTKCAGVIASEYNNSYCSVGAAYNCRIGGR